MAYSTDISQDIAAIDVRILTWRAEAARIRAMASTTLQNLDVSAETLVSVEELSGDIYHQIEAYKELSAEAGEQSGEQAMQLVEVGEQLQLILLEITELGTLMYSVRSVDPSTLTPEDVSVIEHARAAASN